MDAATLASSFYLNNKTDPLARTPVAFRSGNRHGSRHSTHRHQHSTFSEGLTLVPDVDHQLLPSPPPSLIFEEEEHFSMQYSGADLSVYSGAQYSAHNLPAPMPVPACYERANMPSCYHYHCGSPCNDSMLSSTLMDRVFRRVGSDIKPDTYAVRHEQLASSIDDGLSLKDCDETAVLEEMMALVGSRDEENGAIFDMELSEPSGMHGGAGYEQTTRTMGSVLEIREAPLPWSTSPNPYQYNSMRAQIRVIDDDDDEFN